MPDFLTALRSQIANVVRAAPTGPVIEPASTEDTALVLRLATEYRARLSPPGASPSEGRIPIDLRRMAAIVGYDVHSHIVHAEAGVSIVALLDDLRRRGRTLSLRRDLAAEGLGSYLARGAPGARSKDEDPVDQLVAGLTVVLPDGRVLDVRPAPRRAVGPDLVSAIIGARGSLGVITAAHLLTRARRPIRELSFLFPSRLAAEATRAEIRGRGVRPELSDVADAPEGASLVVHLGGDGAVLETLLGLVRESAKRRGGVEVEGREVPPAPLPPGPPASATVADLARAIDPAGVLSGV